MRFYCPKCDLKYRIDDDKLAEHPNGQMRCKACHTVFSLQSAIKLGAARKADGRAPIDGASNLSLPPPKPAPLAWKSTAPLASTPPGKGVVTMPLLDVTARQRSAPPKQVNAKDGATKPGLAPHNRGSLSGPKTFERNVGAKSLLASRGLRGAGERASLPALKLTDRSAGLEATRPAQVLGRGSAVGFPPVTEERTQPAVPPLPRSARAPFTHQEQHDEIDAGDLVPAPLEPAEGALNAISEQREEPDDDLGSELVFSESVPPLTPVVAAPVPQPDAAIKEWGALEGRVDFELEPEPLALELVAEPTTKGLQNASHVNDLPRPPEWRRPDPESFPPPAKAGVSLLAAIGFALLCGAAGFVSGFTLGAKSEQSVNRELAVETGARELDRANHPPPPPPSVLASEETTGAPGFETSLGQPKTKARAEAHASAVSAKPLARLADEPSSLDALGELASGPAGPQLARGGNPAPEPGLGTQAIQSTVQRFQPLIRRACWQPILSRRGAEATSSARVTTTLTIAPTGKVTFVEHAGDPAGYPGLAACIASRVKAWKFPRSTAPTTVNIPFVFAAQ